MENASKALIIAGAILLAILLISLGIFIFGQAQNTLENSGMDQAAITAFNNKFLKYEGDGKKGSLVKALVNEVITTNGDSSTPSVKVNNKEGDSIKTKDIDATATYDVELKYVGGLVAEIETTPSF